MTIESEYMHKTIVIAVIILGTIRVKPSAFLAKVLDTTPRKTAKAKNKYDVVTFIYYN